MGGARSSEQGWQREEVAGPCGTVGDEGEDLGDEALLDARFLIKRRLGAEGEERRSEPGRLENERAYQLGVEFGQARLTLAIEDQEGINHGRGMRFVIPQFCRARSRPRSVRVDANEG